MSTPARTGRLRRPVPEDFTSTWHRETVATRLGLALAVAFGTCFVTGLVSHLLQHPPSWFLWPVHPAWLYQLTQGVHVVTGLAAVPLLLAKLWTVYPRLFVVPALRSAGHGLERASVAVLVAATVFQLVTGTLNITHWYPWGFSFPAAHFALAWVAVGAIGVHVAVKLPVARRAWRQPEEPATGPSRRWLLAAAGSASATVALATAGMTVPWLRGVSVLAVRSGRGPQGVPVNKTARSAGVQQRALDPAWALLVSGPSGSVRLTLAELAAMPQHEVELPIACVEGWSASARWRGVPVADLADLVGVGRRSDLRFSSLQPVGGYRTSVLPWRHVRSRATLVALTVNGEPLNLDHGYPARLIAPSRPGVLQTKWLSRIEVA